MANKYFTIENVLMRAVKEVAGTMPTDLPNFPLASYPTDSLWVQAHNLRSESAPVTLGAGGEDDHRGILQIDINDTKNNGSGRILNNIDIFANYFTVGRVLRYNGVNVTIKSCSASAGRIVGNYYRVSLSVGYSTRTTRTIL